MHSFNKCMEFVTGWATNLNLLLWHIYSDKKFHQELIFMGKVNISHKIHTMKKGGMLIDLKMISTIILTKYPFYKYIHVCNKYVHV